MLMIGSIGEVSLAVFTAIIGITALACGIQGHLFFYQINSVQRILIFLAAIALIYPEIITDAIGGFLVAVVLLLNLGLWRRARGSPAME